MAGIGNLATVVVRQFAAATSSAAAAANDTPACGTSNDYDGRLGSSNIGNLRDINIGGLSIGYESACEARVLPVTILQVLRSLSTPTTEPNNHHGRGEGEFPAGMD